MCQPNNYLNKMHQMNTAKKIPYSIITACIPSIINSYFQVIIDTMYQTFHYFVLLKRRTCKFLSSL